MLFIVEPFTSVNAASFIFIDSFSFDPIVDPRALVFLLDTKVRVQCSGDDNLSLSMLNLLAI
jgi:hypothetical protein